MLGAFGPTIGISPAWIVVVVLGGLVAFSVDAASWQGMGGHLVAEALPGEGRLRRIAVHEAGHLLVAEQEQLPVQQVLVGTLACVRAGLSSSGATEFAVPDSVKMSLEDLRRWSRVLQAGITAEKLVYGKARAVLTTALCSVSSGACLAMTSIRRSGNNAGPGVRSSSSSASSVPVLKTVLQLCSPMHHAWGDDDTACRMPDRIGRGHAVVRTDRSGCFPNGRGWPWRRWGGLIAIDFWSRRVAVVVFGGCV